MRLVITVLLLWAQLAAAAELSGHVIGVTDGDTVTVLTDQHVQERVRVVGIDAPERRQSFGHASKDGLSGLAFDRDVKIVWDKRDRYGRIVGKLMVNGRDVGLEQVRSGMAWHYKHYQQEQPPDDRVAYDQVEKQARTRRLGLWSESEPVPPWEWRHKSN